MSRAMRRTAAVIGGSPEAGARMCSISRLRVNGPVNRAGAARVVRAMSAFVTLAPVYSMPAVTPGDVDLSQSSTQDRSRALNQFLASVELKAFKIAQIALRHE